MRVVETSLAVAVIFNTIEANWKWWNLLLEALDKITYIDTIYRVKHLLMNLEHE